MATERIDPVLCNGCGNCVKSCPALSMQSGGLSTSPTNVPASGQDGRRWVSHGPQDRPRERETEPYQREAHSIAVALLYLPGQDQTLPARLQSRRFRLYHQDHQEPSKFFFKVQSGQQAALAPAGPRPRAQPPFSSGSRDPGAHPAPRRHPARRATADLRPRHPA